MGWAFRRASIGQPFWLQSRSNSVSWDELSAAAPDVSLFDFSEADQNGDGVLSESELANGAKYLEQYNADDVVQSDGGPVVNQPEIETKKGS